MAAFKFFSYKRIFSIEQNEIVLGRCSLEEVSLFRKIHFNITIQRLWPLREGVTFGVFTFNSLWPLREVVAFKITKESLTIA